MNKLGPLATATATVVAMVPPTAPQTQTIIQSTMPLQNITPVQTVVEQQTQPQSIYSLVAPQAPLLQTYVAPVTIVDTTQQSQTTQQQQVQNTQSESVASVSPNMLTDKTNPLTDIVEGKQVIPQNNTTATTGPVVNKNAGDNDVAGGVSIAKMAIAPAGYGDYLNMALRDAAFYAPKEVYKNQRNVDNARVLRLMTNDSKHKEMVEMQYAR